MSQLLFLINSNLHKEYIFFNLSISINLPIYLFVFGTLTIIPILMDSLMMILFTYLAIE